MLVYRLENYKGKGPFSGSQGMVLMLVPHADPDTEQMLSSAGLSKELFMKCADEGFIFGWNTEGKMKDFFRNPTRASSRASEMKMKISIYEVNKCFQFIDGQVLFSIEDAVLLTRVSLKDFMNL